PEDRHADHADLADRRSHHLAVPGPDPDPGSDPDLRAEDPGRVRFAAAARALHAAHADGFHRAADAAHRRLMPPGETLETLLNGIIFDLMMIFGRVASAVMLTPGLGEAYGPARVRLIFALIFSLALMPMLADKVPVLPADLDRFVIALGTEIGIGLFFGS